ncbi:unnamed protein product [Periconia digitata]|uniref:Uncharacterized protein n=1 Tax=Periconia digitata TaxID=1303443 RepID=A0A9W4UNE9_9PLEO|nr:unnamed protein product [Periconia digitata]
MRRVASNEPNDWAALCIACSDERAPCFDEHTLRISHYDHLFCSLSFSSFYLFYSSLPCMVSISMAGSQRITSQNSTNSTGIEELVGWKGTSNDRGTIDILWSSCVTIFLCCWVSTYPNTGSPKDKWHHSLYDKISLALISILGPDFLFGIALGQFSSARRSVKLFAKDQSLSNGTKWTYAYAFFTDMGGIHLTSPDFTDGFPINAEQLHYLVLHKHVDFPDMALMSIAERNTLDTLSRIITVFQAFWFLVTEIQRVKIGLPMTTLELTALSFSFVMFATSLLWYAKPSIPYPRPISTKDGKTVEEIRACARQSTHPQLPDTWHQTPLSFIGENRFRINAHWNYYVRLCHMMRFRFVSRPITTRPWDRFPSDTWLAADAQLAPLAAIVLIGFSFLFTLAWNFHFPTPTEKLLWRVCSIYHTAFSIYGGVYYLIEMLSYTRQQRTQQRTQQDTQQPTQRHTMVSMQVQDQEAIPRNSLPRYLKLQIYRQFRNLLNYLRSWRNISPEQDPNMEVPLRVLYPVTITCFLYIVCRIYIYFEDFFSLRTQPADVYLTVNKFIPFLIG